jgi:acetoin utilization protein AcuB
MIVNEIMTKKLVTVKGDDTLSHAASLMRQHQIHQLPVVRHVPRPDTHKHTSVVHHKLLLLEGIITSQDIDVVVAVEKQSSSSDVLRRPWHERHVSEVMHRATIRVTPATSVAAAAQLLVERGLNYLPVVEYEDTEQETQPVLVGLLTRSDLLIALARAMGAFEPGMDIVIELVSGDLTPLAQALLLAQELHVQVRNVMAAPSDGGIPRVATLRLGTINPTPLLTRLHEANIHYTFVSPLTQEGNSHA